MERFTSWTVSPPIPDRFYHIMGPSDEEGSKFLPLVYLAMVGAYILAGLIENHQ